MIQKKIRSLIYAGLGLVLCVLLCGGIGMTAQAEEETYNGFTYVYESWSDTITILGYKGNKTEIVIPGEIKGKKAAYDQGKGSGKGSVPGACDQSFTELYLSESWSAYWSP